MTESDNRRQARSAVVDVCHLLYERGLVAGHDGNVSVRLFDGLILVTPSGLSKWDVRPEDLVIVDAEGTVVEGRAPTSELGMHLRIYRCRPDVFAVVHAHPPTATGFAVAGEGFVTPILPEVILQMGAVPLVAYTTPGTDAVAESIEPYLAAGHNAFLMANHGATTVGATLTAAHQRMESLEHAARILLTARQLGRVNQLTAADVDALHASRDEGMGDDD